MVSGAMTKLDILNDTARALTNEQLETLIAVAKSMGRQPVIGTVLPDVLAALDKGPDEIANGRTVAGTDVFGKLDKKLRAHGV
jgi:hypothetical protein